jgi:MEDS: MEthanogen/methylotroph, DcmR Sensory domain
MGTTLATGLPGVSMNISDHICAFYRGVEERDQVLLPYLRAGLRSGHKCICVLDTTDPERLHAELIDEPRVESDQLSAFSSEESYLLHGRFAPDDMLGFWETVARKAFATHDYPVVRAVGEMTWALRDLPGVNQLVAYEAELNRQLLKYPQVLLCLYDLEQFTDGEVLIEILRTHPKVLISRMVLDNPWYIEPDALLMQAT